MISAHNLYYFGRLVFLLENAQSLRVHDDENHRGVLYWIGMVLTAIQGCNLRVTLETIGPLEEFAEELRKQPPDTRLSSKDARKLEETVKRISYTLEAELASVVVYVPADRRLDLKKLTDGVHQLFHVGVFREPPGVIAV